MQRQEQLASTSSWRRIDQPSTHSQSQAEARIHELNLGARVNKKTFGLLQPERAQQGSKRAPRAPPPASSLKSPRAVEHGKNPAPALEMCILSRQNAHFQKNLRVTAPFLNFPCECMQQTRGRLSSKNDRWQCGTKGITRVFYTSHHSPQPPKRPPKLS